MEVCFNNTYGSICHDLWNELDAQVVCRKLGFNSTGATALSNAEYGSSSGPIYLDNVQCDGSESSLEYCDHSLEIDQCDHSQDAGVSCLGMVINYKSKQMKCPCIPTYTYMCIRTYIRI